MTPFFGRTPRLRDPVDVAQEIASLGRGLVMFADDNILGHGEHSRALFRALRPLKRRWVGQASLQGMQDQETLRLMAASGCHAVFVGFESVSRATLVACGKHQNDPQEYLDTVRRLHDHGIAVWAAFVFGFDEDTPDVFEATVEFARKAGVIMASFGVLTPYPGTRLFARLKEEGRLFDERWWLHEQARRLSLLPPEGHVHGAAVRRVAAGVEVVLQRIVDHRPIPTGSAHVARSRWPRSSRSTCTSGV